MYIYFSVIYALIFISVIHALTHLYKFIAFDVYYTHIYRAWASRNAYLVMFR
jgi:hypothetical protein